MPLRFSPESVFRAEATGPCRSSAVDASGVAGLGACSICRHKAVEVARTTSSDKARMVRASAFAAAGCLAGADNPGIGGLRSCGSVHPNPSKQSAY